MIKFGNKTTRIAPHEAPTRFSHSTFRNQPKPTVATAKSDITANRLPLRKMPDSHRSIQKSGAEYRTAILSKVEKQPPTKEGLGKLTHKSGDLEAKIRSALSHSGPRNIASPPPLVKPFKSVKFDPAVVSCSARDTEGSGSTQETQFQTCLEAILKCKKMEREKLHLFLDMLKKIDIEHKIISTENASRNTLNPRAPVFRASSSLTAPPPPKSLGSQRSNCTLQPVPKRKFHPRPALAQDFFEPQRSVLVKTPEFSQSAINQQVQNSCQSPDLPENLNPLHVPLASFPPLAFINRKIRNSHRSPFSAPVVSQTLRCVSVEAQNLLEPDTLDDSGSGRVAIPIDPAWAQAILENFTQKYPLTGSLNPAFTADSHGQHATGIQQKLEFILMQKKELAALTRRFNPADAVLHQYWE
jgi:hypothetical protein